MRRVGKCAPAKNQTPKEVSETLTPLFEKAAKAVKEALSTKENQENLDHSRYIEMMEDLVAKFIRVVEGPDGHLFLGLLEVFHRCVDTPKINNTKPGQRKG